MEDQTIYAKTLCQLSVISPVFNEEENILSFYERTTTAISSVTSSYEIIFVDDGSTDNSFYLIEKLATEDNRVKYISFTRNFGHQIALFAGLEQAQGELIVLIDSDLQDPPEIIPELYVRLQEGYEVVYGQRITREGETVKKKLSAKLFYRLFRKITNINIPLDTGDFRIITVKVRDELLKMNEPQKFLRGQVSWLGFKESNVPYHRNKRAAGNSKYNNFKMFRLALDGITSFSNYPLKIASIGGVIFSFIAFLLIIYVLFAKLVWGHTITGWSSIMVTVLFLGGIQLFSIGIIGEYIVRINDAVKNRQLYIVKKSSKSI